MPFWNVRLVWTLSCVLLRINYKSVSVNTYIMDTYLIYCAPSTPNVYCLLPLKLKIKYTVEFSRALSHIHEHTEHSYTFIVGACKLRLCLCHFSWETLTRIEHANNQQMKWNSTIYLFNVVDFSISIMFACFLSFYSWRL